MEAEAGLTAYHRQLKLAVFFEGEEGGETQGIPFTVESSGGTGLENNGGRPEDNEGDEGGSRGLRSFPRGMGGP